MKTLLLISCLVSAIYSSEKDDVTIMGAWIQNDKDVTQSRIYVNGFFSVSTYNVEKRVFAGTYGGKYKMEENKMTETIEFDTKNPERIGLEQVYNFKISKNKLTYSNMPGHFIRVDKGGPGALSGAWLITGRVNNTGETRRSTPGARRTMKILSGTRFQWIAYNVDTKEMLGTGGGTYTTGNGKYTENIEFFSRDNTRVGASLGFEFLLENGEWHHKGLSSKGEPINEIWTRRETVGI